MNHWKLLIFPLALFIFFSLMPLMASAASSPNQVKTKDSPTVYFLSYRYGLKKAYINAAAYLSYGNKWSDIKTISPAELAKWPEAKLFQIAAKPEIYYIAGSRKVLIKSPSDLMRFNLVGEDILTVGEGDLAQYQNASYIDIGWEQANTNKVAVVSDPVIGENNNTLVPNTNHNLLGVFRFSSPSQAATLNSVTFDLNGMYARSIVSNILARDGNNQDYDANVNWRQNDHQIIVNFRTPLDLPVSGEKIVKILADLGSCTTCSGQTMRLELASAARVNASLPASAVWPIQGTNFQLISNDKVIGHVLVQSKSLGTGGSIIGGSRDISHFTIDETSGNEDALIKKITFINNGSANLHDWNNFRLLKNGQVVARTATVSSDGLIVFDINYLRVGKGSSSDLTVSADLIDAYNPQSTYNLQMLQMTAVGATYNLTLNPEINNISESHTLN